MLTKKLNKALKVQECDATVADLYSEVWYIKKTKITLYVVIIYETFIFEDVNNKLYGSNYA